MKRFCLFNHKLKAVCVVFLGFELDIDDDVEEIDMCRMVKDYIRKCRRESRKEGLKEGKAEGLIEGERNAFRRFVARLVSQSRSILEICELTGESEEAVREAVLSIQS